MVYQKKWYAVIVGTEPGIYSTWIEAGPKTKGIPGGAIHQSFLSEEEAIEAFEAAKARGEVKAYPKPPGKKDKCKSNKPPLSPIDTDVSLLMTPRVKKECESTGLQTPLSSPVHSQLRRTLRDSTHSLSTSSSPPTLVTQRDYAPLYEDDSPPQSPVRPSSPHFTFTSSSSRAYPDLTEEFPFRQGPRRSETPRRPEPPVRRDSSPAPSSSDSQSSEEQPQTPPRCLSPSKTRTMGVPYRSLNDLADTESIDSRVWLPKPRNFDLGNLKSQPSTRPSSPVKPESSSTPSYETPPSSPRPGHQYPVANSPFVRTDRGRPKRITPSWSLPILPNCEAENVSLDSRSRKPASGKGKAKREGLSNESEQPIDSAPNTGRLDGRSPIQLVPQDCGDEQNAIKVHCSPNCAREARYRPQYVDACVSPIVTTSRIQAAQSPMVNRPKAQPGLDADVQSTGCSGTSHVSHRGVAPEVDVRSPISRGTRVPMSVAE